jgi:hypothetical protein
MGDPSTDPSKLEQSENLLTGRINASKSIDDDGHAASTNGLQPKLIALVRLLARQAARDFVQSESDSRRRDDLGR